MKFLISIVLGKRKIAVEKVDDRHLKVDGINREVEAQALSPGVYSLLVDGSSYEVVVREEKKSFLVDVGGHTLPVKWEDPLKAVSLEKENFLEGEDIIVSPMPGRVVGIKVRVDQDVKQEEGLITVEAMKMENELHATKQGKVKKILVKVGDAVEAGQELIIIE